MVPADYDDWYDTPRGRWIGNCEFDLLAHLLDARPGDTLLDVGCGTGYFSRRFVREAGLNVTGCDHSPEMLRVASDKSPDVPFAVADAMCLPFADDAFDHVIAVTSLCFVADEGLALSEMVRVARQRVVLGLLNRHSLLHRQKGQRKDSAYTGARWHTPAEARAILNHARISEIRAASAIFLPSGNSLARAVEAALPSSCLTGGFLAIAGEARRS